MAKLIHVTDESFEDDVLNSEVPVLVDFWAEWCGPCKMIGPSLEQLSNEWGDDEVVIAKMDIDDNPATPQAYGVMGIPTLILFKDGDTALRHTGLLPKPALKAKFEAGL